MTFKEKVSACLQESKMALSHNDKPGNGWTFDLLNGIGTINVKVSQVFETITITIEAHRDSVTTTVETIEEMKTWIENRAKAVVRYGELY